MIAHRLGSWPTRRFEPASGASGRPFPRPVRTAGRAASHSGWTLAQTASREGCANSQIRGSRTRRNASTRPTAGGRPSASHDTEGSDPNRSASGADSTDRDYGWAFATAASGRSSRVNGRRRSHRARRDAGGSTPLAVHRGMGTKKTGTQTSTIGDDFVEKLLVGGHENGELHAENDLEDDEET